METKSVEPQPNQQKQIAEGDQQEDRLKGIGIKFNKIPSYEKYELGLAFTLPLNVRLDRHTNPNYLKPDPKVIKAIELVEKHMGINVNTNDKETSTPVEFLAVRHTVLTCLLLATQLGLSPDEIAQNFTPQENEKPEITLMRLIVWEKEMLEKLYQQK
jgi:hypothetical protein